MPNVSSRKRRTDPRLLRPDTIVISNINLSHHRMIKAINTNGYKRITIISLVLLLLLGLSSCSTRKHTQRTDYRALARAGLRLGFDIEEHDNHRLFLEAASWVGTPYRYGGNTRSGVDCSGFSSQIYRNVYHVNLSRSCKEQFQNDCSQLHSSSKHLNQGDLVFFQTGKGKQKADHVGVYLKKGKFIHASSSRGVVVDDLSSRYWKKHWIAGGMVRK